MRSQASKPNVIPPTSEFPYGRIKDDSGNNDGVPVDEQVYGDFHQFFSRLMDLAGITPNGSPESVSNGFQLNDAFHELAVKPQLSFLGTFNPLLEFSIDPNPTESFETMDSDDGFAYIGKLSGASRVIDKFDIKTKIASGFIFIGSDNIGGISVDESFVWVFIDRGAKKIRAFNKISGAEDLSKEITLTNASYSGFRAGDNGFLYIGDNTANEVKVFSKSDGTAQTSIGTGLSPIKDIEVNNGRLYIVYSDSLDVSIYEVFLAVLIDTFSVTSTLITHNQSIRVFAKRIYILNADAATGQVYVHNSNTYEELKSEKGTFPIGGGMRSISIGANYQFRNNSAAVNRIDAHKQEFQY